MSKLLFNFAAISSSQCRAAVFGVSRYVLGLSYRNICQLSLTMFQSMLNLGLALQS